MSLRTCKEAMKTVDVHDLQQRMGQLRAEVRRKEDAAAAAQRSAKAERQITDAAHKVGRVVVNVGDHACQERLAAAHALALGGHDFSHTTVEEAKKMTGKQLQTYLQFHKQGVHTSWRVPKLQSHVCTHIRGKLAAAAPPQQQLTPAGTTPELAVPTGAPPQQQQQLAAASTSRKREAPAANKPRAAKQVKLYAKVARARLGWSGVEAQLFIRMACGYGIHAKSSELRATGLNKKHVANLKEDADKHRRLLGMKKQGSLQITLRCMCAGVLRAPPAAADQPHLLRLAAASSAGTSLEANLEHIPVTLATRDALWELEDDMAEVSMERHDHAKQLVVFFGATGIGTRGTDQRRVRVVLVDEHRTSRVCSAVSGQQPCEEELDHKQPTRPAGWKLPAGQVDLRQLRPAWSWKRDQPMRGTMWCPLDMDVDGAEAQGPGLEADAAPTAVEAEFASPAAWRRALDAVVPCCVVLNQGASTSCDQAAHGLPPAAGPIVAEAIFLNREELPVYPLYFDPVHDFALLRFDPAKLTFMTVSEVPLAPEAASVGLDIRVVGNDSGEKVRWEAGRSRPSLTAVLCCAVLRCAVLCCAALRCAVLCCAVLCCAVLCCAVLCCAVLCCAVDLL
ncbi:hypothetical protein QJQ45_003429 [Haematococcus lacustris]|nr:hypothetical protein QJQ45_003429 [Haematococcus lacustris]